MAMQVSTVIEGAHDGKILCCAYNRARNEIFTGGEDHLVKVWSARTGELLNTLRGHKGWVTCLCFIPELKYLVSGSIDGTISVWTDTCLEVQVVEFSGGVFCLDYSPRQSYVIVGGNATFALYKAAPVNMRQLIRYHNRQRMLKSDKTRQRNPLIDDTSDVSFKALDTGSKGMMQFKGAESGHTDVIKAILATSNGRFITAGFDQRIIMWDIERLKETKPFQHCHTAAVTQLAIDTFSNYVLSSSYDGTVRSWNMEGRSLDTFKVAGDAKQTSCCYVQAVKQYWVCGRNRVTCFDPRSPANITEYTAEVSGVNNYEIVHFQSTIHSDLVLGITRMNQLVAWRYNQMAPHRTMVGQRSLDPSSGWIEHLIVVTVGQGTGGEHIISATNDGTVTHWRLDQEQHTDVYLVDEVFTGHEGSILALAWEPEFEAVLSAGDDATIRIWYLDRRERTLSDGNTLPTVMHGHEEKVTALALLPDQILVSISFDQSMRKWDLNTMSELQVVEDAHDHGLTCIDYSEELHQVATCGGETVVKVWDADELTLVSVLDGHKHEATQVRWAAFKQCWVTVGDDDTVRLWDKEGEPTKTFDYYGDSGLKMHIDNFNQRMLLACMDRIIRVYDLKDPHPLVKYEGHLDTIRCLGYISEFGWYVSGSWDKTIRLWLSEKHENKFSAQNMRKEAAEISRDLKAFEEEDDVVTDERYRSSYERAHPLVPPRTLRLGSGGQTVLRSMGFVGKKGKKGGGRDDPYDAMRTEDDSPISQTGLGSKLAELEHRLNPPDYEDDYYYGY